MAPAHIPLLPPIQTNASVAPGPIVAPLLVGSLIEFLFFGGLVVQTYVYRVCFPNDQFAVKLLVYSVLLAMIVWICLSGAEVVFSLGTNFGDILVFKYSRNSYFLAHIMGALVATSTHLFFCYRILVISRAAWPLCIFIALISTLQCAGGTGAAILSHTQQYKVHVFYNAAGIHTPAHTILLYLWLICGALADILITCTMSFLLLKAAVTSNTRHLIKHVVQLTIEANAFSAATALVGLALFVALPACTSRFPAIVNYADRTTFSNGLGSAVP
ncbi:hypothetical protein B0H11DRAFT_2363683 [Mycena galericulata]|nr:hypothetical protein B0H11DRAFT_2363683 [Mycena galericulata]